MATHRKNINVVKANLRVDAKTLSQDRNKNESRVQVDIYMESRTPGYNNWYGYGTTFNTRINNSNMGNVFRQRWSTGGGVTKITSYTRTIKHNSDGRKTFTISVTANFHSHGSTKVEFKYTPKRISVTGSGDSGGGSNTRPQAEDKTDYAKDGLIRLGHIADSSENNGDSGWNGKMVEVPFNPDKANNPLAENWEVTIQAGLESKVDPAKRTGILYFSVLDEEDRPIAQVRVQDSNRGKTEVIVIFEVYELYEDNTGEWVRIHQHTTQNFNGSVNIKGQWTGNRYTYTFQVDNHKPVNATNAPSSQKNKTHKKERRAVGVVRPARKVGLYMGRLHNSTAYQDIYIRSVKVYKLHDGSVADYLNSFMTGDSATFNMSTGQTHINGVLKMNGRAWDSDLINVRPGITPIRFMWSTWAKQPRITVKFRERFLGG